jgi:hypothetical protein
MNNPVLKQKQAVTETPVINGFSYPFLRRLIDELKRLKAKDAIFGSQHITHPDTYQVNMDVAAMLNHVRHQMNLEGESASTEGDNHIFYANMEGVVRLIWDAENFLAIFEATNEDLTPQQAPPGQPLSN